MICLTNLNLNQNELQNAVLQPLATAPANPKLGQLYTDSSAKPYRIKWYNGEAWELVGVVYEKASAEGKVLTGLSSTGGVTTIDVKELKLIGYAPVSGGYISAGDSLEKALQSLDTAVQNAVAGGGEVNQLAFSNVKVSDVTVSAGSKTDTVEFAAGTYITLSADADTKKVTISVNIPAASASAAGLMSAAHYTKVENLEPGAQKNVKPDWNAAAESAAEILNKPTKLSEFTNDEGFIDNTVSNLTNYYAKSETLSKTEIEDLVGGLATISIQVVSGDLPATGKSNIIYLKAKATADGATNIYDEYLWDGTKFERIGDTTIDLSNYLTKTGDASKTTVAFTTAATRTAPTTGDALDILVGKIAKYFADLKPVAFSGAYSDLSGTPATIKSAIIDISTTETSKSITVQGTQVLSVTVTDTVSKEIVLCDVEINGLTVTVSVASTPANALRAVVAYY